MLAWLSSYPFGTGSYNHCLMVVHAVFDLAVEDKILVASPVENLKAKRPANSIRQTPSSEEFQAIVADISAWPEHLGPTDSGDFFEFPGLAGLGQAEASFLKWSDIDWQNGPVTILRHKMG